MAILSFFRKEEKEKFLVLDIGTEAVKALVFSYSLPKGKKESEILILNSALEYFDEFSIWDSRDFSQDVVKRAISKILHSFREESCRELNLLVSLPPNYLKSRIILQKILRNNPKENISKKEADVIMAGVEESARKESARVFSLKTGVMPQDLEFFNLKVLEMKIDGYEVSSLEGYAGEKLEFRILTEFILKDYLESFDKILKSFDLMPPKIISQSRIMTDILSNQNVILFDIGGDATQFFLIRNGKLEIADEFDFGGRNFSQKLSDVLGMDEVETRYFKETYSQNLFSEGVRKKTNEILSAVAEGWMNELKSKINERKFLIPSDIIIYGGGSLIPEIGEVLGGNFQDSQVSFLKPEDLKNIRFEAQAKSLENAQGMAAAIIAAQRFKISIKNAD